jgi:pimeloyl-ACP methyl ester carboxylesterase
MATFVLVHGGWAGGWQWRRVAGPLRAAGHDVFTPTLTGLGERVHLASPAIALNTHVEDVANVLHYEDLTDVILVGYSYSGMVITGVAERMPERLAQLVYLDAFVPEDGQSLADLLGPQVMAQAIEVARQHGDGWRIPLDPPEEPVHTDQPLNTAFQPIRLRDPRALALPRTFVHCPEERDPADLVLVPIDRAAARAKSDPAWHYRRLAAEHRVWKSAPEAIVQVLLEIAEADASL